MTAAHWAPGFGWALVRVSSDVDGLVVVEPLASTAADGLHGARLDVVGGTVVVDVTRAGAPPRALLSDPGRAQDWLTDIYGPAVADLVDQVGRTGSGGEVEARRGPLAMAVVQLGVGAWLHRWWPDQTADRPGVDERLLEIELGSLAWQAGSCYSSTDPAARLLTPHAALLADLWQSVQSHATGADDDALSEVLSRALAATVDIVSPSVAGWSRCSEHLAELTARRHIEDIERPSAEMWAALERKLGAEREPVAARSGGTRYRSRAQVVHSGRSTVDVRQVPPRIVSAEPDNVAWRVVDRDGVHHVEVTVAPAFGVTASADPGLRASVVVAGVPTVLSLTPEGAVLRGGSALVVPVEPDDDVTVEVFHPDYATTLRRSPEGRAAAEADRSELGRILDGRLADLGPLSLQAEREAARRRRV